MKDRKRSSQQRFLGCSNQCRLSSLSTLTCRPTIVVIVVALVFISICDAAVLRNDKSKQHVCHSGPLYRGQTIENSLSGETLYEAYKGVLENYRSKALDNRQWRIIKKTKDDVEIAILPSKSDPNCPYMRISAVMPTSAKALYSFMSFANWGAFMRVINPFYDDMTLLTEFRQGPVRMMLARKRTTRIVGFGRRDFSLVSVSDAPNSDGVLVSGTFSVITPMVPRQRGYTRAFQDSISFYKPIYGEGGKENCLLTIICRTDLNDSSEDGMGGWVPMWLFVKTFGTAGGRAIQGLRHLVRQDDS